MSTAGPSTLATIDDVLPATSKMRSHRGNQPVLPQDKLCPLCSARFTRTTHLNRHMRNHTKEGLHACELCGAEFTRTDLLTRHIKTCQDKQGTSRRKSCLSCTESKVKCDRELPCSKCKAKGKECVFPSSRRRASRIPNTSTPSIPHIPPPSVLAGALSVTPSTVGHLTSLDSSTFPLDPALVTAGSSVYPAVRKEDTSRPAATSEQPPRLHHDVFQPLFASLFSGNMESPPSSEASQTNPTGAENFPFSTSMMDVDSFSTGGTGYTANFSSEAHPAPSLPLSNIRGSPSQRLLSSGTDSTGSAEHDYYVHLFYNEYLKQMPIAHEATFRPIAKSPILLSAMASCGALFVRTRAAADFIAKTLGDARDAFLHEFAKNTLDTTEQIHLILAVVLLQTIGLFHQNSTERSSANIYHGMVVMMVRRTGLVNRIASWQPELPNAANLESSWSAWGLYEMTKRCLWMSYLHDTCHAIYFALACSYSHDELNSLTLPCENRLFQAKTSTEWSLSLQTASAYGPVYSRLTGVHMVNAFEALTAAQDSTAQPATFSITPFGHFILSHRILRRLFEIGINTSRLLGPNRCPEMLTVQLRLHNWLQCWLRCPDAQRTKSGEGREEPPFLDNALPFYWLAQVAILAFQDNHPPFNSESAAMEETEARFRLVKRWLQRIRQWLESSDEETTLFWGDLMKFRLKEWRAEPATEMDRDQGLVGFFPANP